MLPEGTYNAQLLGARAGISSKGTPFIALDLNLTHRADGSDWLDIDSQQKVLNIYLSDAAWPNSEKKLKGLGFNGNFEHPDFSETQFAVQCKHEPNPRDANRYFERLELANWGNEAEPMTKEAALQLAARWRNSNKPAPKPTDKPAKPTAQAQAKSTAAPPSKEIKAPPPNDAEVAADDDSIPF